MGSSSQQLVVTATGTWARRLGSPESPKAKLVPIWPVNAFSNVMVGISCMSQVQEGRDFPKETFEPNDFQGDRREGSECKGACHQALLPEFDPGKPHGERRDLSPLSYPLSLTRAP